MSADFAPLTREEVERFEGVTLDPAAKVWGASYREDGEIQAMAGVVFPAAGDPEGFLRYRVGFHPPKMWVLRRAKEFRAALDGLSLPRVVAYCDPAIPNSERFVAWLGFKPNGEMMYNRKVVVRDGN